MPEEPNDPGFDVLLAGDDEIDAWAFADDAEPHSLVDLVNRVLDKGVCITGDITISVAGVDLVYLGLNAILTSVATARRRIDPAVGPDRPGGLADRAGGRRTLGAGGARDAGDPADKGHRPDATAEGAPE